jgi:hypothetical protein
MMMMLGKNIIIIIEMLEKLVKNKIRPINKDNNKGLRKTLRWDNDK